MGLEKVDEALRASVGGALDFGARRGFLPPSWVFVGTVELVEERVVGSEGGASVMGFASSTSLRFRFRTT